VAEQDTPENHPLLKHRPHDDPSAIRQEEDGAHKRHPSPANMLPQDDVPGKAARQPAGDAQDKSEEDRRQTE
jgi:hypothetical protein